MVGKGWTDDWGGGSRVSFCQLVLGLLLFWASLFIYLFIIIVMLCVSFLNLYSII